MDDVERIAQLEDAYAKQVEHTDYVRVEYQERLARAQAEIERLKTALEAVRDMTASLEDAYLADPDENEVCHCMACQDMIPFISATLAGQEELHERPEGLWR